MAACVAAELSRAHMHEGAEESPLAITIYEATDKIGRPILKSGNGRCNLTNADVDPSVYRNSEFVTRTFEAASSLYGHLGLEGEGFRYPNNIVASYFEQHGVVLREEAEGRIYPLANKASVMLDALKRTMERFGVEVKLDAAIASIDEPASSGSQITLRTVDGEFIRADHVIDATGGTQSKGELLSFVDHAPRTPVLGPIVTDNRLVKRLDNIRVRGKVSLLDPNGRVKAEEHGEVMLRKYGVSGIAVFDLSRFLEPGDRISIDFVPHVARKDMDGWLRTRCERLRSCAFGQPTNFAMLNGVVLPEVADALLRYAHLDGEASFSEDVIERTADALKSFTLECREVGDPALCQVARGGYSVDEVDAATMAIRRYPHIHITGEALDVDAPCGGYNLHWAFLTGMIAARSVFEDSLRGAIR